MISSDVLFFPADKGYSLVAFHFSVNQPLQGTSAGQFNVDLRSATGELGNVGQTLRVNE